MASTQPVEITRLLRAWGGGDQAALDRLAPLVYRELHRLARRHMHRENPGNTLQTTALVNEAATARVFPSTHDEILLVSPRAQRNDLKSSRFAFCSAK